MIRSPRNRTAYAAWLLLICAAISLRAEGRSESELDTRYRKLTDQAAATADSWRPAKPSSGALLFIASDQYSPLATGDGTSNPATTIAASRRKLADELYGLAKEAADAGQLSLAFQWATEAVRENPDHADARRVLGYEQREGQWVTAYGAKMFDAGKVWEAERGWVPRDAPKSPPLDAAKDAARHADMKNGWQVRTDHFLVTTNASQAAGAELAARLERLYQIWRQLFAGYFYTEKEVRGLFAGDRNPRTQARPFRVFYYRNRDEYIDALRRRQPRIGETLGIYFDTTHEAFFFDANVSAGGSPAAKTTVDSKLPNPTDEPSVATKQTNGAPIATLYHEAVHQLFQESKPTAKRLAANANFWVIEGVANYFETLTEHGDDQAGLSYTIGEANAGRLPAARERLRDGSYVPFAELTKLNKDELQRRPDVAKLYSESTGLAAFLLDGEGGRYREAFVRYLAAVYAGRDSTSTLIELTGASYDELDAAYRRFSESLP